MVLPLNSERMEVIYGGWKFFYSCKNNNIENNKEFNFLNRILVLV